MSTAEITVPESNEKQEITRLLARRAFLPKFSGHLKSLFLKSYSHHNRVRMRVTLALGLLLYLLAGIADLGLDRDLRNTLWLIRFAMTAPIMAAALATLLWIKRDTLLQIIYAIAVLAAGIGVGLTVSLVPQAAAYSHGMSVLIILLYIYIISGMRIGYALVCALSVSGLFLAGALANQTFPDAAFQVIVIQMMVVNLFGAYAGYRLEKTARHGFLEGRMVRLLHDEMLELVGADELTGLANRRRLDEFYANTWLRAQRDKAEVSLLFIDVDYLQLLNDHLGRPIGDICLRKLGAVIQHYRQRPGDLAARYEGGKFLLILYGCNERHGKVIGEHLRRDVESLNLMNPASPAGWTVSVSIGVHAVVPSRNQSPASALMAADTLLYIAKKRGRNRVVSDSDAAMVKSPHAEAMHSQADKTLLLPKLNVVK
ncbi:MAG: GGDEF domain-containing protein [Gammaproteobacteria bacterium]